jgi:hypothetical protein
LTKWKTGLRLRLRNFVKEDFVPRKNNTAGSARISWGPPGIGKYSIIHSMPGAVVMNLPLIKFKRGELRTALRGIPTLATTNET